MPCDDGDDEAFLVGVAMSIGEVVGIVERSTSLLRYCGVEGCMESGEDVSKSRSGPSSASLTIEATLDLFQRQPRSGMITLGRLRMAKPML